MYRHISGRGCGRPSSAASDQKADGYLDEYILEVAIVLKAVFSCAGPGSRNLDRHKFFFKRCAGKMQMPQPRYRHYCRLASNDYVFQVSYST